MIRMLVRAWPLLAALLTPFAAQAQVTLTGDVSGMTCVITTFDNGAASSQSVPCDAQGTTFTVAANQSLGVLASFTYRYEDQGGTFAAGVLAACTSGPCAVDPIATHEYGQLWGTFTFCPSSGDCGQRTYPISFYSQLTDGPDVRAGEQSVYEVLYPTYTDARTVTVSFDLEMATYSALAPVPEPSTWALLAIGLIAVHLGSRRRRHDQR